MRLVHEARERRSQGEQALASAELREALALWHGSPLVDLADEPFAEAEIARLDGLRVARSRSGWTRSLHWVSGRSSSASWRRWVRSIPIASGCAASSCSRSTEPDGKPTLSPCTRRRDGSSSTSSESSPSRALQRLERAILRHESGLDALLDVVDEVPEQAQSEPPEEASRVAHTQVQRRSRLGRPLLVFVCLVIAAGVVAVAVGRATKDHVAAGLDANAVGIIDPDGVDIKSVLTLDGRSNGLASDGDTVWIAGADGGTIRRIIGPDHRNDVWHVVASADGVDYGAESLWVTNSLTRSLVRLNPSTFGVVQRYPVGNGPRAVEVGEGAVWVANTIDGTVSRIGLDGTRSEPIPVGPGPLGAIAVGGGGVWVSSEGNSTVFRIDPRTAQVVKAITVGNGPSGIDYGEAAVWVANRDDGTVSRIDPATNIATTISVGDKPEAVAAGLGAVWVANSGDGTIARIDPKDPGAPPTRSHSGAALTGWSSPAASSGQPQSPRAATVGASPRRDATVGSGLHSPTTPLRRPRRLPAHRGRGRREARP